MKTRIASISLDLDNQWSYMKTHGDEGWEQFPSYLDKVVPRFLEVAEEVGFSMTVMIVGQDAAIESNHDALRQIPASGHRVGNHSFHHEPWLHLYNRHQVETEIDSAESAIKTATGETPRSWRGPGFSFSETVFEILAKRGYEVDGSTFPTYLGPLARAYYFMTSRGMSKEDRKTRDRLFGKFSEGFRPLRPYHWSLPQERQLLEIPVTTFPVLKAPFHLSYLLYLATFSTKLAEAYLAAAAKACRIARVEPSFLLHPLDFMGGDDVPELAFFPAMNRDGAWKMNMATRLLKLLSRDFQLMPMEDHARAIQSRQSESYSLPILSPA